MLGSVLKVLVAHTMITDAFIVFETSYRRFYFFLVDGYIKNFITMFRKELFNYTLKAMNVVYHSKKKKKGTRKKQKSWWDDTCTILFRNMIECYKNFIKNGCNDHDHAKFKEARRNFRSQKRLNIKLRRNLYYKKLNEWFKLDVDTFFGVESSV